MTVTARSVLSMEIPGESPYDTAQRAIDRLDQYGWQIVRKPTGDAVDVAIEVYAGDFTGGRRAAMAAALTAAAAAGGRTPDESTELRLLGQTVDALDRARAEAMVERDRYRNAWRNARNRALVNRFVTNIFRTLYHRKRAEQGELLAAFDEGPGQ